MFDRLIKLIGTDNLNKIKNKKILIIGLGGVGGIAIETLVRNGIENITLVDKDIIDITNKNRQVIALDSTIGKYKVDAFYDRLKDINDNVKITKINEFINKDNIDILFNEDIDFVIDACDTITTKILIIEECIKRDIKFISSMGMGKKLNVNKIKITDIKKTSYDKIAKVIRKKLREDRINSKVPVIYSDEEVIDTKDVIGSYSPVTSIAGIMIADYVIKEIIKE